MLPGPGIYRRLRAAVALNLRLPSAEGGQRQGFVKPRPQAGNSDKETESVWVSVKSGWKQSENFKKRREGTQAQQGICKENVSGRGEKLTESLPVLYLGLVEESGAGLV